MISIAITTYNEEANIKQCLQSIKDVADEIIVVDGSSTDKTRDLAKDLGARIIKTTNKKNFHINKQMAIDACKGDLILQLDADEVVDKDLSKFIEKIATKTPEKESKDKLKPVAWYIKRKNYFMGRVLKKGGQYPDSVIRLFYKGKAELPLKDVHEQMRVTGETAVAEGHLLHYSNPSFKNYLRKFNTYTRFKAQQLKDDKLQINFFNSINYLLFKPMITFLSIYFRHKGFMDGFPGFIFALFSGFHHCIAYLKLWELYEKNKS